MIRFHDKPNEKSPRPSLLEPAPKRFRTKVCRPLSTRQMIEIAVRRGNCVMLDLDFTIRT